MCGIPCRYTQRFKKYKTLINDCPKTFFKDFLDAFLASSRFQVYSTFKQNIYLKLVR